MWELKKNNEAQKGLMQLKKIETHQGIFERKLASGFWAKVDLIYFIIYYIISYIHQSQHLSAVPLRTNTWNSLLLEPLSGNFASVRHNGDGFKA